MSDTVTTKRMRNGSVILTDRHCEKRVDRRVKIYDRKCPGLYVSITTAGMATFNYKFTSPETGKQRTAWLGVHNPETFTVEDARSTVYGLKAKGGTAIAETLRQHKVQKVKQGKTVGEIIEERIEWMKTPVLKRGGEMRPRIESWENVARHLRRFVGPTAPRRPLVPAKSPATRVPPAPGQPMGEALAVSFLTIRTGYALDRGTVRPPKR
jgi:hypothetical protein